MVNAKLSVGDAAGHFDIEYNPNAIQGDPDVKMSGSMLEVDFHDGVQFNCEAAFLGPVSLGSSATVETPTNDNSVANKKYVDTQVASIKQFSYIVSTSAATTPKGYTWYNGATQIVGTLEPSSTTEFKIYLIPCIHTANGTQKGYDEYLTVKNGNNYSWEALGNTQDIDLSDYAKKSDITSALTKYVTIDTTQEISGQKTFTSKYLTVKSTITNASITLCADETNLGNPSIE